MAAALFAVAGPCCRLTGDALTLMGRVRRLFFMSESQDLSRFLVTDLGICRYPQYRCAVLRIWIRQQRLYIGGCCGAERFDMLLDDPDSLCHVLT